MAHVIKPMDDVDVKRMAKRMRPMDRFEFKVMSGGRPALDSLEELLRRSRRAAAAYHDDNLVCCYGVVAQTALSTIGHPWMCATPMIASPVVRKKFLRHSIEELAWMSEGFDMLWNLVSTENKIAIRWLKWMGFNFTGDQVGLRGHPFAYFKMEAEDVLRTSH